MQSTQTTATSSAGEDSARRMPTCIPVTWTDKRNRYHLAYPRSPWDGRRYLVCRITPASTDFDTLAVVDDFGGLVETHCRNPRSPMGMGFMRMRAAGVQA